jgi:hypothetical protein
MFATGQTNRSATVSGLSHVQPCGYDGALGSEATLT